MIRACIRVTMLAVPLIAGSLGCATSSGWMTSSQPAQAAAEAGLSGERLMAIGRMLERQGRLIQAQRVYESATYQEASHAEAARRLELLAAYERKLQGLERSPQIAELDEQIDRPAGDVPVAMVDAVESNDTVVTSDATDEDELGFSVEIVATDYEELRQFVDDLNELRPLVRRLEDDDPAVRREAVTKLAERGPAARPALAALSRRLTDADTEVRVQAARAIWEIDKDSRKVIPELSVLVSDPQAIVCCMAAFLLGEIGPTATGALPALRETLPRTSGIVRVHVAEAIARIDRRDRGATDALVELLGHIDGDVRWLATCGLATAASGDDPRVVAGLRDALQDDDVRVREAAAVALAGLDPESATDD